MSISRDLQLRQLHAFVAVADERSFGHAADLLGFTQSAVSQQIASLERVIGQPLFDRPGGPKPVQLTPAGVVLLEHARTVLERVKVIETEVERLRLGESGSLVIGSFQSASVRLLPTAIGRMHAERPGVGIRIIESEDEEMLFGQILDNQIDACFAVGAPDDDRLTARPICTDPYVVLAPRGAEPGPIPLDQLRGMPLIGAPSGACQNLIDSHLHAHDVLPEYVFRSPDNSAIQALVRARLGYAVMPKLAVDEADPEIDVLSISPQLPPRRITLVTKTARTGSPALERFCELVDEAGAEIEDRALVGARG